MCGSPSPVPSHPRPIPCAISLASILAATNIVCGCVAEDGSALHGVKSVATGAEEGPDAVVHRIIAAAKESVGRVAFHDHRCRGDRCGGRRTRSAGQEVGHGAAHPEPGLGQHAAPARLQAGLNLRTALDNDAKLRGTGWSGGGARRAIPGWQSDSPLAPVSAAASSSTADCTMVPRTSRARWAT